MWLLYRLKDLIAIFGISLIRHPNYSLRLSVHRNTSAATTPWPAVAPSSAGSPR